MPGLLPKRLLSFCSELAHCGCYEIFAGCTIGVVDILYFFDLNYLVLM